MDILIILAEVIFVLFAFALFYWLVGIIFKQLNNVTWLKGKTEKLVSQRRNIKRGLILTCAGLCMLLVVWNGWLMYQGKDVLESQLNLVRSIPPQFWLNIVVAIAKTVIVIWLVKYSIPYLHRFLDFACDRIQNFDDIDGNDQSIDAFFIFLKTNLTNIIWIFVVILCSQFLRLPKVVPDYLFIGLKAYIIITIGLLIVKAITAIIETIDVLATRNASPDNLLRYYKRLHGLVTLFKKCLEYVIYVGTASIVVQQIDALAWMAVYGANIIQIISIFFFSGVAIQIANAILEDLVLRSEDLTDLQKQRRLTIIPLFKSFLKYTIYFTAGISMLKLIGIDPTPVLAGAGILGIAVGFGAQNLINDIVCGFFILFENYYLVGDYIEVNQAAGFVEAIDLRTTRIRHSNGQQHILRNGEIKDIVNYSKQYIYAVVEVGVCYETDLNYVYGILEEVGKELKENYQEVLQPTQVEGVENFGGSELLIRTITKVKPGNHFQIQRILRKMIKDAFDREGIAFPDAANVVILNNQQDRRDSNG